MTDIRLFRVASIPAILILLAVSLVAAGAQARPLNLTILHLNDVHGYIQPDRHNQKGGLAKAVSLINRIKAQQDNSIFLMAGDLIEGTALSEMTQGRFIFDALNLAPPEAMCLGNHEFGYGLEALRANIDHARFPVLGGNVIYKNRPSYKKRVLLKWMGSV